METVTVKRGDTLWGIAEQHLGDGGRWQEIFALNEAAILEDQRRRCFDGWDRDWKRAYARPEHWIFPGIVLTLPPKA